MKKPGHNFWVHLALVLLVMLLFWLIFAVWLKTQLTPEQISIWPGFLRSHIGPLVVFGVVLLLICALSIDRFFRNYIRPIDKIVDEIGLIFSINPNRRLPNEGGAEVRRLCDRLNEGATQYESVVNDFEAKVRQAQAKSTEEKNILAAIMGELPEGILACNRSGVILLYNNRAKMLLEGTDRFAADAAAGTAARTYIGLGRSIYHLFDTNLVGHAIDELAVKLARREPNVVAAFVSPGAGNRLLRIEAAPVLDHHQELTGFILMLTDITRQIETSNYLQLTWKAFLREIRASLGGIRSAIETMIDYPDMAAEKNGALQNVIHKEALKIADLLERDPATAAVDRLDRRPLVRISVVHLVQLFKSKAGEDFTVHISPHSLDPTVFIKADSYSFLLVLLFAARQIKAIHGVTEFSFRLAELDRFVGLDLIWQGPPVKADSLRQWEDQPLTAEAEGLFLSLRQVIDYHDAEIGALVSRRTPGHSFLRFFLPVVYLTESFETRSLTILPQSRPEFYEFDLFEQPGQTPELENRLLTDLTYTVFDLETTGLDPDGGDEIVSIGAYRVVNCRVLQDELFDQLINPRRPIPWESVKIHGLLPEVLQHQPTIEEVLPSLHRFAADTILVAHNAAFDMRFLQLNEKRTGLQFVNPVLDTLLLSAVVHPALEDHNLEAIARRLGINVIARHTATGDALATAEILLKLLPLLAGKKIYTLKEAIEASRKSYYARKEY
jgi:DNA polymerase-3 subunit epsilon